MKFMDVQKICQGAASPLNSATAGGLFGMESDSSAARPDRKVHKSGTA